MTYESRSRDVACMRALGGEMANRVSLHVMIFHDTHASSGQILMIYQVKSMMKSTVEISMFFVEKFQTSVGLIAISHRKV
jgi:hypothetical protein